MTRSEHESVGSVGFPHSSPTRTYGEYHVDPALPTPTAPFRAWLAQQQRRNDAVGDLARDVAADTYRVTTARALMRHVELVGGCPAALDAVVQAAHEWAGPGETR